jgi:hypothetical protein
MQSLKLSTDMNDCVILLEMEKPRCSNIECGCAAQFENLRLPFMIELTGFAIDSWADQKAGIAKHKNRKCEAPQ